ncbi:BnaC06g03840D [Brassica napus]|uniref:(rape) hypothetical protein n=1 Tax=Brassica napus TaxID=3708 RepID=A0A078HFF0_BRANA|nr:unnamed protein product [Brassica napus]CDY37115.1 BnaC06g03840D [Brassica napus]
MAAHISTTSYWSSLVAYYFLIKSIKIIGVPSFSCSLIKARLVQVEGWLSRVARIDSQVSGLLNDKPTETKRLCVFRYCSTKCISSCEYGKKVSKKLEEVNELYPEGVFKDVAGKRPAEKVETKRIQTTVGLDSMVGKAWNSIMKPEGRTLGIYGMGGVGKTTLLATINNKLDKEANEFAVVIWVVVSQDLQYRGIQDQILGRLCVDKDWEKETEKEKASSIANILGRKKFIVLLDDLWSEEVCRMKRGNCFEV